MMDGLRYRPATTPVGIELPVTQELSDTVCAISTFLSFAKELNASSSLSANECAPASGRGR